LIASRASIARWASAALSSGSSRSKTRVDLAVPNEVDQLWQEAADPRRPTELLDRRDTFVAARFDDVCGTELAREALALLVAAHGDDSGRAELLGGEHGEQPDRAVAHGTSSSGGGPIARLRRPGRARPAPRGRPPHPSPRY
jgi:hypothetical protein